MPLNIVRCDWSPKTNYRRGRGGAGLKEKNYKENKYASSARDRARRRRAERAAKWDRQTNQFTEEKQDHSFETGRFDDAPWPEHLIEYYNALDTWYDFELQQDCIYEEEKQRAQDEEDEDTHY